MLQFAFALASAQVEPTWETDVAKALDRARDEKKLALVVITEPGSALSQKFESEVLSDRSVSKNFAKFVLAKLTLGKGSSQFIGIVLPQFPTICLIDEKRQCAGIVSGFTSKEIIAPWLGHIDSIWKRRDSLVFRSKGKMNDSDSLQYAFLLASAQKVDEAKSRLPLTKFGVDPELRDFAMLALAQAFEVNKDEPRAIEQWIKIENGATNFAFRCIAKCAIARHWLSQRPEDAAAKLKQAQQLENVPEQQKWYASYLLKMLEKN